MKLEKINLITEATESNRAEDILLAKEALVDQKGKAFSKIYNKYYDKVYSKCLYMLSEKYAEDATQEIFTKVFLNLNRFKGDSSLGTWIFTIATNHCIDVRKKQKNDLITHAYGTGVLNDLEDDFDKVVFAQENEEGRLEFIMNSLNSLPPKEATLLEKEYFENKSMAEIAEEMGETVPAIKTRIMRLKRRLYKEFVESQRLSDN